ncbi:MAG: FMN-binding protein [Planctomycetota bacterium]
MRGLRPLLLLWVVGCVTGTVGGPVRAGELSDGVYEGEAKSFPNKAKVRVTVQRGRIHDVEILSHFASGIGHKADDVIPQRIVEEQSTAVDAVTGATNSSRVIMNAVEAALKDARR